MRHITLVSPRLVTNPNVRVIEEDLAAPVAGKWDVVRAANILNHVYFSESQLEAMVANVASQVRVSGLLAICRTVPQSGNHGSVFKRINDGFEEVGRIGGGSEVAAMVLRLPI